MKLVLTEAMVLLVVWLLGRLWRVEAQQAKINWMIATACVVGFELAAIAMNPHGAHEQAMELTCGGALGLLVMMASQLKRASQR